MMLKNILITPAAAVLLVLGCGGSGGGTGGGGGGDTTSTTTTTTSSGSTTSGLPADDPCQKAWDAAVAIGMELMCSPPTMPSPCPNIYSLATTKGCETEYQTAYECVLAESKKENFACKADDNTPGFVTTPCTTEGDALKACLGG